MVSVTVFPAPFVAPDTVSVSPVTVPPRVLPNPPTLREVSEIYFMGHSFEDEGSKDLRWHYIFAEEASREKVWEDCITMGCLPALPAWRGRLSAFSLSQRVKISFGGKWLTYGVSDASYGLTCHVCSS